MPDINGDPFTDSQEYPDRFTLGEASATAAQGRVRGTLYGAGARRELDYLLAREPGGWVVDDILDGRGQSLRALLRGEQGVPRSGAQPASFAEFLGSFRAALAAGNAAELATLVQTPFLYQGQSLDTAGVQRVVPELFTPALARCLATAEPQAEQDRQVLYCAPYTFYFGPTGAGYRLLEFGADGEAAF